MTDETFDAVIVGGGVIGCSVAYYLARQGCRVVVLEKGAVGGGASSVNPGSIALSSKQPGRTLRLAVASRLLYQNLSQELDADIEFAVDGNLTIAETEEELRFLEALTLRQREAGIPVRLVSADECRRINPLIEGHIVGGAHCPVDAHTNPFQVTAGFARAAARHGAQIRTGVEVLQIEDEANAFRVTTSHGVLVADQLVNAAGLAAPRIGAMRGVEHSVVPRAGHVMVFEATEDLPLVKTASASQLMSKHGANTSGPGIALSYNRKPRSGTVLLGGSNQLGVSSTRVSLEIVAAICAYATRFMPALGRMNVIRAWVGLRPYTTGGPVLGRCCAHPRYLAAFGHGGDGMALAPITGRYIAAQMLAAEDLDLDNFLDQLPGAAELDALTPSIPQPFRG